MITDKQVTDLTDMLPETSFIRQFCRYGHVVCDAPDVYFLGAALAVLSSVIDPDVTAGLGAKLPPPLWCLLIGGSGSRKTSAANKAVQLLRDLDPLLVGSEHESPASLLEDMGARPQQLIFHGEFGDFLGGTREGSYKSGLRETYMKLWDGVPVTKTKLQSSVTVDKPRLSLLCCVAPSLIEKHTNEEAWTGGFFSRFLVFVGEPTRRMTPPPTWDEMVPWLENLLGGIYAMEVQPPDGMTEEACEYFAGCDRGWFAIQAESRNRWLAGIYNRLATTAIKVALCVACDGGSATQAKGGSWQIGLEDMKVGVAVAEMVGESMRWVLENLALTPFARDCRVVEDALGLRERDLGQILKRCRPRMSKRSVSTVLETLVEEGSVLRREFAEGEPITFERVISGVSEASPSEAKETKTKEQTIEAEPLWAW